MPTKESTSAGSEEGAGPSPAGLFPQTLWSDIRAAARANDDESFRAISVLCERYRRPLLVYLQRSVRRDTAEDLLQGFLVKLVDRRFFASLAPEKGKFRPFLLPCLKNHLRDELNKQNAQRRGGGRLPASLDETSESGEAVVQPVGDNATPDMEFDRAWARTLLHRAFRKLESEYRHADKEALFSETKDLLLALADKETPATIADRLNMGPGSFRVAVHRLKARLGELVREQVEPTVASPEDLQNELHYMTDLFGLKSLADESVQ